MGQPLSRVIRNSGCRCCYPKQKASRSGEHARAFLQDWKGKLVCDDFGGYKASFALGVTEIGCMAHARRKFFDLHATNKSQLAEQALRYIQVLYEIEQQIRDLEPDARRRIRQEKAAPAMDALYAWMIAQRELVHDGVAIARALDYSLKRWTALSRYLDDGAVPIDNNHAEQQIRPWALGRNYAQSEIMSGIRLQRSAHLAAYAVGFA
ncbi:MAG: putative transposase, family [Pseudomonas sp.]|nr:putative transposase, family [Pseudomonas sp.]